MREWSRVAKSRSGWSLQRLVSIRLSGSLLAGQSEAFETDEHTCFSAYKHAPVATAPRWHACRREQNNRAHFTLHSSLYQGRVVGIESLLLLAVAVVALHFYFKHDGQKRDEAEAKNYADSLTYLETRLCIARLKEEYNTVGVLSAKERALLAHLELNLPRLKRTASAESIERELYEQALLSDPEKAAEAFPEFQHRGSAGAQKSSL